MAEVEYTGYGSKLGRSCMGVVLGPILFIIAFPVLFWNEGRAVHRAQTLAEGKAAGVDVSSDKIDEGNEGKLVHTTGEATTSETLFDKAFGIAEKNAIKLTRTVEIYQWKETATTKTEKQLGGKEKKTTVYTHKKEWVKEPINSTDFRDDENGLTRKEIRNFGSKSYPDQSEQATVVKLGAFTLSDSQVKRMGEGTTLPVTKQMLAAAEGDGKTRLKIQGDHFYIPYSKEEKAEFLFLGWIKIPLDAGSDNSSDEARIGDQRITFKVLKPEKVSVLARQSKGSFDPWPSPSGTGSIDEFKVGTASMEEMITQAETANVTVTWILRFVGFALMAFGIYLVGSPFVALADILPILGNFVSVAIAVVAILIALPLTLITIAIGWCAYRPWVGYPMLAVGVLGLGAIIYLGYKRVPKPRHEA